MSAGENASKIGAVKAYRSLVGIKRYFETLRDVTHYEGGYSLLIVCPDCGKQVAFRGGCPKCGSESWVPAGHCGGIEERRRLAAAA